MTKIFFDTEFTGLHKNTTLMSIGLIDEFGDTFYAELTDYDESQVNEWLRENVIANFRLNDQQAGQFFVEQDELSLCKATTIRATKNEVNTALILWLANQEVRKGPIQMWSDCLAYDWVLFNDLLADYTNGYPQLPAQIHYIPMDICPLFEMKGVNPDISREEYSGRKASYWTGSKHNALHDALTIKDCYYKLQNEDPTA
ncbi:3'-5' exoribonuclease domain-containing protein [Hymenobacter properus]|uniref:3'-5' exoribonuclease n=1 Tax=Hymenobacter properus TaxID=2791026 RepID=A0A931FII6_9BACT|nr:3'-5' exoribonuclease [Hymenobacter properus]MBF9140833.1 3'-5' exoribonuclease [Hymenobacter properus]MBR7719642.1 3'-5' exoribonuclease [Microvirga sp. SRT04]